MSSRAEIIKRLEDPGIIAVVRARQPEQVGPLAEALVAGGVMAIEVTMTTPNAIEVIRRLSGMLEPPAVVGVGSVTDQQTAQAALDAGAAFVVSPICRPELVGTVHAADRPVMIGAFTPTEAQLAYEAGADYVKVFPAEVFGPKSIKSLRAPLPHLRIVPTGGVDLNTAGDFLRAGCVALGVGSSLVAPKIVEAGDWAELTRLAREFVRVVSEVKR